jgi:hypothetical protein
MCEPTTLMMVSVGLAAVGTGVGVYGAIQQGQAQKAQMDYQAGVAKNNQIIATQNATWAAQSGEAQAEGASMRNAQNIGRTRAIVGASGVNVDAGSPLKVLEAQDRLGMLDALTIKSNAARAVYGYNVAGMSYGAQSQLDTAAGKFSATAGDINAVSSIAGGASSVSDKWLYYQRLNPSLGGGSPVAINPNPAWAG